MIRVVGKMRCHEWIFREKANLSKYYCHYELKWLQIILKYEKDDKTIKI